VLVHEIGEQLGSAGFRHGRSLRAAPSTDAVPGIRPWLGGGTACRREPRWNTANLPPQTEALSLITNALRHGEPGGPLQLSRTWTRTELRITVGNPVRRLPADTRGSGFGLTGMAERLAAIGGSHEASLRDSRYVATAIIPVASASAGAARTSMILTPPERTLALAR